MSIRKSFTIEEKFAIICRFDGGEKCADLAREFEIPRSTLAGFLKCRDKIINQFDKCESVKKIRNTGLDDLDDALLLWFKQQRANNIPINGPILQQKANDLGKLLNLKDFECSSSWIQRCTLFFIDNKYRL